MPRRRAFIAFCLSIGMLATATAADVRVFPPMQAETLSATALKLPEDFAAGPSIIVLVYDQNQQADSDSWLPFLTEISRLHPDFEYYFIPVLPPELGMVRGMIEGTIRDGADPAQLARTIMLFTHVAALHASLGVTGTSAIHTIALNDQGDVIASVSGPYSAASGKLLTDSAWPVALEQCGDIGETGSGEHPLDCLEKVE